MDAFYQLLKDNNIRPCQQMKKEREEQEYYTVTVFQIGGIFIIDPNQPMLEKLNIVYPIIQNRVVLTTYMYQQFLEIMKVEQGIVALKIIKE